MTTQKTILRALAGETLPTQPIWMMRQAGRYLPEYRATRAQAGDFLSLCYNSELAAEVTLQPIRRYGFDASILFADILLLPQALGADLWFVTGEGPRLSTITDAAGLAKMKPADAIHDHLAPVYETVRILSRELPKETTTGGCTQGNLKSSHMVTGGQDLIDEVNRIKAAFANGPHIFNLGHGITPDADPENVQLMIDTLRAS